jgi:hypothetical protein
MFTLSKFPPYSSSALYQVHCIYHNASATLQYITQHCSKSLEPKQQSTPLRFKLRCQGSYEEIELPTATERFLIRFPATFYVHEKLLDKIFTSFPHSTAKKKKKKAIEVSSTRPSLCAHTADSKSRLCLALQLRHYSCSGKLYFKECKRNAKETRQ